MKLNSQSQTSSVVAAIGPGHAVSCPSPGPSPFLACGEPAFPSLLIVCVIWDGDDYSTTAGTGPVPTLVP